MRLFTDAGVSRNEVQQYVVALRFVRCANRLAWRLGAGLFPIIDACERLENLDLTSCRGVKVSDRRRFFEVRSFIISNVQQISALGISGLGGRVEESITGEFHSALVFTLIHMVALNTQPSSQTPLTKEHTGSSLHL